MPSWKRQKLIKFDETNVYILLQPEISFGVEFEGNVRGFKSIIAHNIPDRYAHIGRWSYQTDYTAFFELRSPVWTDINQAHADIVTEFQHWINVNNGAVPFFKPTKFHYNLGGHIHLGVGEHKKIKYEDATKIPPRFVRFMPFLYFMNANGVLGKHLSKRLTETPYSRFNSTWHLGQGTREEWHMSPEHGTIEMRRFDANIPAVKLAEIFLLTEIIKNAKESQEMSIPEMQTMTLKCCENPPKLGALISVKKFFNELKDVEIKTLPHSVKEVLALSFVCLKNPALFIGTFDYEFCKQSALGEFIEAKKFAGEKERVAQRAKEIAEDAEVLGDLLTHPVIIDRETYYLMKKQNIEIENPTFIDDKVQKNVEDWLKKDKKPPFIGRKAYENLAGIIQPTWVRLSSLTLEQRRDLEARTHLPFTEIQAMVSRWHFKVKHDKIVGWIKVNRPESIIEEVTGEVTQAEANKIFMRIMRGTEVDN